MYKLLFCLIAWIGIFSDLTWADGFERSQVRTKVSREEKVLRSSLYILPEFATMTVSGTQLTALAVGPQLNYAFNSSWSILAGLKQGFDIKGGFKSSYSTIEFGVIYALSGNLISRVDTTQIDGEATVESRSSDRTGWRAFFSPSLYLFHGSTTVIPVFGPGVGVFYEGTLKKAIRYVIGAQANLLNHSGTAVKPIRFFSGIGFEL